MKKSFVTLFIIFLGVNALNAEEYTIKGKIDGLRAMSIKLLDFHGKENAFFDSARVSFDGEFTFTLTDKDYKGVYRLRHGANFYIDFIFDHSDVFFKTDFREPVMKMQFINSKPNTEYYSYLKKKKTFREKTALLLPLKKNYPKDDDFYFQVIEKIQTLQAYYSNFVDSLARSQADAFVKKLIIYDRSIVTDPYLSQIYDKELLKRDFFEGLDLTDTTLLNSEAYANLTIAWLAVNNKPEAGRTKQAKIFKKISSDILERTSDSPQIYEFEVDFLINGFKKIHFEDVVDYIVMNNRIDENCVNTTKKKELEQQIERLKASAVGSPAPKVTFTTFGNETLDLYEIEAERTLLVFWASWCDHCKKALPSIAEIADKQENMKVLAVSIDRDTAAPAEFLDSFENDFIRVIETDGWDSPVTNAFNVYGTPSYFLLDKDMTIIAKPLNLKDLRDAL